MINTTEANSTEEEVFILIDYNNLDFSKEEEIYYSNAKEKYNLNDIEIKVK